MIRPPFQHQTSDDASLRSSNSSYQSPSSSPRISPTGNAFDLKRGFAKFVTMTGMMQKKDDDDNGQEMIHKNYEVPSLKQQRLELTAGVHQNEGSIHVKRDSFAVHDLVRTRAMIDDVEDSVNEYDELDEIERKHNARRSSAGQKKKRTMKATMIASVEEKVVLDDSDNTSATGQSSAHDSDMDFSGNHLICEFQPRQRN